MAPTTTTERVNNKDGVQTGVAYKTISNDGTVAVSWMRWLNNDSAFMPVGSHRAEFSAHSVETTCDTLPGQRCHADTYYRGGEEMDDSWRRGGDEAVIASLESLFTIWFPDHA